MPPHAELGREFRVLVSYSLFSDPYSVDSFISLWVKITFFGIILE